MIPSDKDFPCVSPNVETSTISQYFQGLFPAISQYRFILAAYHKNIMRIINRVTGAMRNFEMHIHHVTITTPCCVDWNSTHSNPLLYLVLLIAKFPACRSL